MSYMQKDTQLRVAALENQLKDKLKVLEEAIGKRSEVDGKMQEQLMKKVLENEAQANENLYEFIKTQVRDLSDQVNNQCSMLERKVNTIRKEIDLGPVHQRIL